MQVMKWTRVHICTQPNLKIIYSSPRVALVKRRFGQMSYSGHRRNGELFTPAAKFVKVTRPCNISLLWIFVKAFRFVNEHFLVNL